jgi:hypothetical protein
MGHCSRKDETVERDKKRPTKLNLAMRIEKAAESKTASLTKKKALIDSLCGSLAWVDYSVDEYLREKREEVKRENGK